MRVNKNQFDCICKIHKIKSFFFFFSFKLISSRKNFSYFQWHTQRNLYKWKTPLRNEQIFFRFLCNHYVCSGGRSSVRLTFRFDEWFVLKLAAQNQMSRKVSSVICVNILQRYFWQYSCRKVREICVSSSEQLHVESLVYKKKTIAK